MQSDWTFEAICRARLRSRADPGHSSDNFTVIAVRDREKVFFLHQPLTQQSSKLLSGTNAMEDLDINGIVTTTCLGMISSKVIVYRTIQSTSLQCVPNNFG